LVEAGGLSLAQAGYGSVEAKHAGRLRTGATDCRFERAACKAHQVRDCAVERQHRPGQRRWRPSQRAAVALNVYRKRAKRVAAVAHACRRDSVGDQDRVFGFDAEPETDQFRGDVDTIADQFRVETLLIENDAEYAGFAMIERMALYV